MFYQPEWFFAHIQNVSHEHRPFMDDIIQRLLKKSEYRNISAWVSASGLFILRGSSINGHVLARIYKIAIPSLIEKATENYACVA